MSAFISRLIDPSGLTPHGFCLAWDPGLIWLQAGSDILIALAYYSIPLALLTFARRRADLAFPWMFWLFAAFIMACGTTHIFGALTLWVPAYWPDGIVKAVTAVLSVGTAAILWPLLPQALELPSPDQLRRMNHRLGESEARYRALFTRAPVAMYSLDSDMRVVAVSDAWLDLLGYVRDEVIGEPLSRFQPADAGADIRQAWDAAMRQGVGRNIESRFLCQSGEVLDGLVSATVENAPSQSFRSICVLIDVTARKRAEAALAASEARLRQTEKMTALGQLAGGIAHDFNNVLQMILGGVGLIRRKAGDAEAVGRLAGMVEDATRRGASITRRLLAFARRDELRAEPIDVGAMLGELREVLAHTLGPGVAVTAEFSPDLPPILADRGQLDTALVNLAANARDAMAGGGTLTLSAHAEVVAERADPNGLAAGAYVRLTVADTGAGMDPATLARAAEPFFTTKPRGHGTGLGLAMARGFAEQSGGMLTISSAPGAGTTVEMWLRADEGTPAGASQEAAAGLVTGSGRRRVLLVDDEAVIREVLAEQITEAGYDVVQAESAARALELLVGGPVDLMISDLSMPGMDGLSLLREVRGRGFGFPAILLTGYAGEAAALIAGGAVSGAFSVLRKPVSGAQLTDRIAALLTAAAIT